MDFMTIEATAAKWGITPRQFGHVKLAEKAETEQKAYEGREEK